MLLKERRSVFEKVASPARNLIESGVALATLSVGVHLLGVISPKAQGNRAVLILVGNDSGAKEV